MKPVAVVGLLFGDEGKGTIVDFLTRELGADRVGRFCGGAQALHHVHLPDGTIHGFSQFAAGTFAGAKTELNQGVIVNPISMMVEADLLKQKGVSNPLGLVTVDENCLVTTPFHTVLGRAIELSRGPNRHGTTGMGVGETLILLKEDGAAIRLEDFRSEQRLYAALSNIEDIVLRRMDELGFDRPNLELPKIFDDFVWWSDQVHIAKVDWSKEPPPILEGSQGTLLDPHCGFAPYVTKTPVTADAARASCGVPIKVLGVTRAYATRHGRGPFPTEGEKMPYPQQEDNKTNDWQEHFRSGWLDLTLLRYAVAAGGKIDGVAVTHIDELGPFTKVCESYEDIADLPVSSDGGVSLTEIVGKAKPVYALTYPPEGCWVKPPPPRVFVSTEHLPERIASELRADLLIKSLGPTHRNKLSLIDIKEWLETDV